MFPTHVGMNRLFQGYVLRYPDVPHTRGDEPVDFGTTNQAVVCSPHTWG